jgi:hypothetical protein
MTEKTPIESKKPYKAPVLLEYGDIRQITQNTANTMSANSDGGSGSTDKTH